MLTAYDSAIKMNTIAKLSEALMTHSQCLITLLTAMYCCTTSIYPSRKLASVAIAPRFSLMH